MNFDKYSEKELLTACIQGDKKAWNVFVEKYTDLVYHTIHKTLNIYHPDFLYRELEDIHNSIFLSLIDNDYKKLRQYKGINGCTVSSWIRIIATNAVLNFIKKGSKTHISFEDTPDENKALTYTISDPQPSVIEQIAESEQVALLGELMEGLKSNDRLFLKYYYEEELPPEEIAEIMNITVSAIYSKKSRIIDKLKKIAKKKKILQENRT